MVSSERESSQSAHSFNPIVDHETIAVVFLENNTCQLPTERQTRILRDLNTELNFLRTSSLPEEAKNFGIHVLQTFQKKHAITLEHLMDVGKGMQLWGEILELSPQQIEILRFAGIVHDAGKDKVDEQLLKNSGELSSEEYEQMKKHVTYGVNFLQEIQERSKEPSHPVWNLSELITESHHEKYNGKGYPHGTNYSQLKDPQLKNESLLTSMAHAADIYSAMRRDRGYNRLVVMTHQQAMTRMHEVTGTTLDPEIKQYLEHWGKKMAQSFSN